MLSSAVTLTKNSYLARFLDLSQIKDKTSGDLDVLGKNDLNIRIQQASVIRQNGFFARLESFPFGLIVFLQGRGHTLFWIF